MTTTSKRAATYWISSWVCAGALSIGLLGGGCDGPPDPAGEAAAIDEDSLSTEHAAEIARIKLAQLPQASDPDLLRFAGCGTGGPTDQSVRVNDAAFRGAARQRSGSSTGCPIPGVLQPTDDALYFCFTVGNDGFTWTYNQNLRTGVRGWTRDDLLRGNGSSHFCGF